MGLTLNGQQIIHRLDAILDCVEAPLGNKIELTSSAQEEIDVTYIQ